jgi:uncharacterized protein YcfJ
MKSNTLAIALAALLVGGVAVGAFHNSRDNNRSSGNGAEVLADADAKPASELADAKSALDYADVVNVVPVTEKRELYATVIGSEPLRETVTSNTPREVCEDVVVQERLPERDGNVGGTVAGAVIGGLVGNQVGGGKGRKLATVAGAAAGGVIGNRVDRNHVGGKVVERVDRQCRTVQDTSESSRVVAWNVTYRNPDGTTATMRTGSKPGERIALGTEDAVVGYDVTYRYDGVERTVRLEQDPGERLPVLDGQVLAKVAGDDQGDGKLQ